MILTSAVLLCACGGGDAKKDPDQKAQVKDITKDPDYQKGLALVAKADNKCLTCHSVDQAVTGPSYRDVANRYANHPDTIIPHLARKIISGGKGEWGEIFMTANSGLSQEDAEAMVKYILLLKK